MGFTAARSLPSAILGQEATPLQGPLLHTVLTRGYRSLSDGDKNVLGPSPLPPPVYLANMALHLSIVLNLRIILIMIKIKCLPMKRLHDLKNKTILGISKAKLRAVPRSPLPSWWALTSPRGLLGFRSEQGQVVWASCFFFLLLFFLAALCVCVCFMFKWYGLVWWQPEKSNSSDSEGPTHVSTEGELLGDDPRPTWGTAEGLERKEPLNTGLGTLVQCATSAGRESHQPVSSARDGAGRLSVLGIFPL